MSKAPNPGRLAASICGRQKVIAKANGSRRVASIRLDHRWDQT
jgi:hypothetical protein